MLTPSNTAQRLVDLVVDDKFKSGAHIDYWDPEDVVS